MSYIEDCIFVFSYQGWEDLCKEINKLTKEQQNLVKSLLNSADTIRVSFNADRLFKFFVRNTNADDFQHLRSCLLDVGDSDYLGLFTGENSSEEEYIGDYHNNPFIIGIQRIIHHDFVGNDFTGDDMFLNDGATENVIEQNIQPLVNDNAVINDHTCISCGNSRCSKNEKSCWRCGCSI